MKSYLITDPKYYSNNPHTFSQTLEKSIQKHNPDYLCFRDKSSVNKDELIKSFLKITKKYNKKSFINSYINSAIQHKTYGVHLNSKQFSLIKKSKDNNLKIVISTHNTKEIKQAIENKVDYITYSPIFDTPNKGQALGIDNLKKIQNKYNIPIIALGGIISNNQIEKLKKIDTFAFASIRYFID
jgi:thiamine-phosphate pyrophosphorylase